MAKSIVAQSGTNGMLNTNVTTQDHSTETGLT